MRNRVDKKSPMQPPTQPASHRLTNLTSYTAFTPRTHVARATCIRRRKHVAGYKSVVRDTCWLYLGDIITIHLGLCHVSRLSLCNQQQTGDKLATVVFPIQETCWRQQVDTRIRQHDQCKLGFLRVTGMQTAKNAAVVSQYNELGRLLLSM